MVFTENELTQIRDLLNLPVRSLLPGSAFRFKAKHLENYDIQFNTNLVSTIQGYLTRITEIDGLIQSNINSNTGSLKREKVDSESEFEYQQQKDYNTDYRRERESLIDKIARDFEISRNTYLTTHSRFRPN